MNNFRKFSFIIFLAEILLLIFCNVFYVKSEKNLSGRLYRVETERVAYELKDTPAERIDLSAYKTILKVSEFNPDENCNNDYMVLNISNRLYRIEYKSEQNIRPVIYMNIGLGMMFVLTIIVMCYIYGKVLKPFHSMSSLSCELAKGNLSVPIKEEKSKLFGHFLWGMDMLRDNLETNKRKELQAQKEKKTLILSLSHDIKTPLSAIDLYARALSDNLYDSAEKRNEAVAGIVRNTEEIKKYVNEIVTASREDFLNLEVKEGEFYLSEIMNSIEKYYREKMAVLHIKLELAPLKECLLKGDRDRVTEVLQNVMENALKYGDGGTIEISYDEEEECRLITIKNTGCSLPNEELPHLFDSFYRGSNSHGIEGSGLGLYICKHLMKKMSGDVFADTDGENFSITVVIRKA